MESKTSSKMVNVGKKITQYNRSTSSSQFFYATTTVVQSQCCHDTWLCPHPRIEAKEENKQFQISSSMKSFQCQAFSFYLCRCSCDLAIWHTETNPSQTLTLAYTRPILPFHRPYQFIDHYRQLYHGLGEHSILIGCRVSINLWYMDTY